ncbi:nucleotidyltransferase domain-containing protein [Patescibacteria group bacterium]
MKTVFVLSSTMDTRLLIKSTNDLKKALKPYQKTKKVGKMEINLWDLLCSINFEDDKRADDFVEFLHTDAGKDFIIKHIARNPANELKKLISVLPKSCPFYVIGGLAIDGYIGKLTRMHNDADLMCWRKDIKTIKTALNKIGYKIDNKYLKDDPKKVNSLETDEENPILSVNIIDEVSEDSFEISIGKNIHQIFPKKYLGSKRGMIDNIKFLVPKLELLDSLNRKAKANLNRIKKANPKLYSILGSKIINNKHDRKLLNQLMKK